MSQIADLEAEAKVLEAQIVKDSDDDSESMLTDLVDSFFLLRKCLKLMAYLGDKDLCKGLSARERETIEKMAGKVHDFLDEVEPQYEG